MNVMAEAHKRTKAFIAKGDCLMTYAAVLRVTLRHCHSENKVEFLKAHTIAKFEARVVELQTILTTPDAAKFMVVCGDEHPMPVNFESKSPKWPWANVEGATKWDSMQFARANASKVVNGNAQAGKAVKVADHIEWDIANLQKLVKELKEGK